MNIIYKDRLFLQQWGLKLLALQNIMLPVQLMLKVITEV